MNSRWNQFVHHVIGVHNAVPDRIVRHEDIQLSIQQDTPELAGWTCEFWRIPVKFFHMHTINVGDPTDIDLDHIEDQTSQAWQLEDASIVFNVYSRSDPLTAANAHVTIFSHGINQQFVVNRQLINLAKTDNNGLASNVKFAMKRIEYLLALCQTNTFIVYEYPLFGFDDTSRSSGFFSEANAALALKYVIDHVRFKMNISSRHINLIGYSFGTGPTIRMARYFDINCAFLMAPYTNLFNTTMTIPSFITLRRSGSLASLEHIKHVCCPILFMHGTNDNIIDCNHSTTLYKNLPPSIKIKSLLFFYPCDHSVLSSLIANANWADPIKLFLRNSDAKYVDASFFDIMPDRALVVCDSEKLKFQTRIVSIAFVVALFVIGVWIMRTPRKVTTEQTAEKKDSA